MSSTVADSGRLTVLEIAPRDERLDRSHHLDVAHVRDRALADRDVEHRQVLLVETRSADDRAVLVDVGDDLLDLLVAVAERLQRERHGAVDDRHLTAADQLLELDQREVRLDAGRVAVHQERDRARRREHRSPARCGSRSSRRARPPPPMRARAASSSAVSAQAVSGIAYEASRCIRITALCASRFSA